MPRVGGRDFAYTPEGRAAALAYSQQQQFLPTPSPGTVPDLRDRRRPDPRLSRHMRGPDYTTNPDWRDGGWGGGTKDDWIDREGNPMSDATKPQWTPPPGGPPPFRTPDGPPNVYRDTTQAILDRRRSHEIPAEKVWAEDVDREHLDTVRQEVRDAFNQLPPDARRDPATRQRLLEELSSRARDRRRASRPHDEYGRFGYEDTSGRQWNPRSLSAGRR
jgi:hypothetical protein